eukprot:403356779
MDFLKKHFDIKIEEKVVQEDILSELPDTCVQEIKLFTIKDMIDLIKDQFKKLIDSNNNIKLCQIYFDFSCIIPKRYNYRNDLMEDINNEQINNQENDLSEYIEYRKEMTRLQKLLFQVQSEPQFKVTKIFNQEIMDQIDYQIFTTCLQSVLKQEREGSLSQLKANMIDFYTLLGQYSKLKCQGSKIFALQDLWFLNQEKALVKYSESLMMDLSSYNKIKMPYQDVQCLKNIYTNALDQGLKSKLIETTLSKSLHQYKEYFKIGEFTLEQLLNDIADSRELVQKFDRIYQNFSRSNAQSDLFSVYESMRQVILMGAFMGSEENRSQIYSILKDEMKQKLIKPISEMDFEQTRQLSKYIQNEVNDNRSNYSGSFSQSISDGKRSPIYQQQYSQNNHAKSQSYQNSKSKYAKNGKSFVYETDQEKQMANQWQKMRTQKFPAFTKATDYMSFKKKPEADRAYWEFFFEAVPIEDLRQPGFVYILKERNEAEPDVYKVGYSTDINLRMAYLYQDNNKEYELITFYQSIYYQFFEFQVKERLKELSYKKPKQNGYTEWFKLDLPLLKEYMEEIGLALAEVHHDPYLTEQLINKLPRKSQENQNQELNQSLSQDKNIIPQSQVNRIPKPPIRQNINNFEEEKVPQNHQTSKNNFANQRENSTFSFSNNNIQQNKNEDSEILQMRSEDNEVKYEDDFASYDSRLFQDKTINNEDQEMIMNDESLDGLNNNEILQDLVQEASQSGVQDLFNQDQCCNQKQLNNRNSNNNMIFDSTKNKSSYDFNERNQSRFSPPTTYDDNLLGKRNQPEGFRQNDQIFSNASQTQKERLQSNISLAKETAKIIYQKQEREPYKKHQKYCKTQKVQNYIALDAVREQNSSSIPVEIKLDAISVMINSVVL